MRCVLGLSVVAAAAAVADAQTTWIVDCQNGPGTNFLDIPAAVAAASDGDRIVIRGRGLGINGIMPYTAPTVDGKGLTFVREGSLPAQVVLPWNIRNLAFNQTVVLSDLQLGRPGGASGLVASNNHGLVVLDRVVAEFNWGDSVCTDCDLVIVTRSDIWARYLDSIVVTRSRLVIHDSQVRGFQFWGGGACPLQIGDSTAWLVNSYLEGVSGTVSSPNFITPAISVGRSDLFLGANTTIYGGYFYGGGRRCSAITDWGTVAAPSSRVHYDPNDPSVVMDDFPGFQLTYGPVSSLALAQTATDLTLTQRAVPMSLTLLVAGGLTTTPWSSVMGPAFIDPNDVRFVELRIAPSTGAVTRGFTIPPGLPQGFRLAFQGAGLSPANVLSTTNPVLYGVW